MSESTQWDRWLADADSVRALAPEGYEDGAALVRVKALRDRLIQALSPLEIKAASPELYQDSTGLAHYRITAGGDTGAFAPVLAWVLLSHFGDLATVADCQDPQLLERIRRVLEEFGLKYIPYDYVAGKTYDGKCSDLVGFSWANRYFELAVKVNEEGEEG